MSSMKSDHYYAEMLNLMREQGKKDNPSTIQLGIMQGTASVKINDLTLNAEDLYIADNLVTSLKKGDLVAVQKLSNNMYAILVRVVRV